MSVLVPGFIPEIGLARLLDETGSRDLTVVDVRPASVVPRFGASG
ncbi:hypothetical protein [Streptomyces sp. NBC_01013]|nr:hypothetical protein OG538_33535 [Streptomyces sp. NBC_01013]